MRRIKLFFRWVLGRIKPKPKFPWRFGPPPIEDVPWSVNAHPSDRIGFRIALEERNEKMERNKKLKAEIDAKLAEYNQKLEAWKDRNDVS